MRLGFLTANSSRPETCMLKNKKVSDMRSLMTRLSLLDLLCVLPASFLRPASLLLLSSPKRCLPSHYSLWKACMQTLQGLLPETCCLPPDFFLDLPNTCTFLLPETSHAAAALPLHFCPGPSEHRATGPLLDPAGDYPRFTQFLLLSIFSIILLPFPITLKHLSSPSPFS